MHAPSNFQADDIDSRIHTGDFKLFLMAISGIKGNKRMNVEPPEEIEDC